MKAALFIAATTTACVTAAGSLMVSPTLVSMLPMPTIPAGSGGIDPTSQVRLALRAKIATAEATRDAIAAADAAPAELHLQRRAVAMIRTCAGDEEARKQLAQLAPQANATIERLVATTPCPGLADAAATWVALGENAKGGEAYVAAANQCGTPDAVIAAVGPLRAADRCDEAITALRAAWPHVQGAKSELAIAILDGVTSCSDALTLRRNLSFVPAAVMDDYFALVEARERERREAEQRDREERAREEARQAASEASFRCQSECSAAVSSCESSCQGDGQCVQSCSAVGHVCNSGC
ncbi:MAG TPA: hypothetical protein VFQ65_27670 [Kofleriaceae bacterium]|nr:hypothetical protein [Kofleriaceae bacterium]